MLPIPVAVRSEIRPAITAAEVGPITGTVSRIPVSKASSSAWWMPRMTPSPIYAAMVA